MNSKSRTIRIVLTVILLFGAFAIRKWGMGSETDLGGQTVLNEEASEVTPDLGEMVIDEEGIYDTASDVSLYLYTFERLPENYITKDEARKLGWDGGSVEEVAPNKCIGGDYYGNYEGLLPEKDGREYYECDIDTLGKSSRGARRIVYSNDGLIYLTEDHYETFTLLYGEELLDE